MIKKLQRRFILVSVLSLTVAMVAVVLTINIANRMLAKNELMSAVEALSEQTFDPEGRPVPLRNRRVRSIMRESLWFIAKTGPDGEFSLTDDHEPHEVDESEALELALRAQQSGETDGYLQDYVFKVRKGDRGMQIAFLNVENRMASLDRLAIISAIACGAAILLCFAAVSLLSERAIKPVASNIEQQKQFITNASHELKTPLSVISADMELLQMETGENSWIGSIRKQLFRMRHLVDEMVYLSRMEESGVKLKTQVFSLDELFVETAEPFAAMAEFRGRCMNVTADPGITVRANRESMEKLISVLCDNAVKYADGEGAIFARAERIGREVRLTVSNPVQLPLSDEQCKHLFERFYRNDPARSKERQAGFGIGLAVAAAVVEYHKGSIKAGMSDGRLVITCTWNSLSCTEKADRRSETDKNGGTV